MLNACFLTLIPVGTVTTALILSATFLCGCAAVPEQASLGLPPIRMVSHSAEASSEVACSDADPFLPAEVDVQPESSQAPDAAGQQVAAKPEVRSAAPVAD
jgi:hypothetical protein